jgi:hypothetical protein
MFRLLAGDLISANDCLVHDGSKMCAFLLLSHPELHSDQSFGCDVLLRRPLSDAIEAFAEPVTLSLASLTPPLTPAFSLSPSLDESSDQRGEYSRHRSSGHGIAHFQLEISFCGPFR